MGSELAFDWLKNGSLDVVMVEVGRWLEGRKAISEARLCDRGVYERLSGLS